MYVCMYSNWLEPYFITFISGNWVGLKQDLDFISPDSPLGHLAVYVQSKLSIQDMRGGSIWHQAQHLCRMLLRPDSWAASYTYKSVTTWSTKQIRRSTVIQHHNKWQNSQFNTGCSTSTKVTQTRHLGDLLRKNETEFSLHKVLNKQDTVTKHWYNTAQ